MLESGISEHLSAKQLDFIANSDAPINIADGAVRAGKTISGLLRWLGYIAEWKGGGELFMVGKTKDTVARNCFAPLQDDTIFGEFSKFVKYTAGANQAVILGKRVHVLGANDIGSESKIRGATCGGSYVDELSLIPQAFWRQLVARHSIDGAQIFANTNPDSAHHWIRKELLNGNNPDVAHWHFTMDDNPKLSEAKKEFYRRQYSGMWYKRFILGLWVQAEGAVYDMWDEDKHVVSELPLITRWLAVGVDYGTTNPFAGLALGLGVDGRVYLASEYRWDSKAERRQKTDAEYSVGLRDWIDNYIPPGTSHPGIVPESVCVDPSAASFKTQLWRDGLSPREANNDVLDGIRLVSSLLGSDQLRVHKSCQGLIGEMSSYAWDETAALRGIDKPKKEFDHSLDAARYAIATTHWGWRNDLLAAKNVA